MVTHAAKRKQYGCRDGYRASKDHIPGDDVVVWTEVNIHADDKGDGSMCLAVLDWNHSCSTKVKRQQRESL